LVVVAGLRTNLALAQHLVVRSISVRDPAAVLAAMASLDARREATRPPPP
jgi:hypothetical protein